MPNTSTVKKNTAGGVVTLRLVSIQVDPSLNVGQKSGYSEDFSRFLQENLRAVP